MNLAIFEPDIPQNTGAMVRICSCFDVNIDIIHPDYVHKQSDQIIRIPMNSSARSLNVAVSSAIVISEANRQLKLF